MNNEEIESALRWLDSIRKDVKQIMIHAKLSDTRLDQLEECIIESRDVGLDPGEPECDHHPTGFIIPDKLLPPVVGVDIAGPGCDRTLHGMLSNGKYEPFEWGQWATPKVNDFAELAKAVANARAEHLERFAAAFFKQVGSDQAALDYVLVEEHPDPETVTWRFEKKGEKFG